MEEIRLQAVIVEGSALRYQFSVTEGLEKFFSGKPFVIEYPVDISGVPEAVLTVPFVSNVLPIVWLTDSKLILPALDKDFFDCIPNVKKGYETMFPESVFAGEVCPGKIVECGQKGSGCAALFSGGLDATQTLVSHFDEKPHLISIWGSDIEYSNEAGWKAVHDGIAETAQRFDLPDVVIRSSFRDFDNEGELDRRFFGQLKDGWWHGVKHGLALLGHAAPYACCMGLSTVYIASSNCPADGAVRCASNPLTDNHVRFAVCRVVHDGFEYSRQDKVHNVVEFVRKTGQQVTLHACWQSRSGNNCCRCEKCYRTMMALIAEGAEPEAYGFADTVRSLKNMRTYLIGEKGLTPGLAKRQWRYIRNRLLENQEMLADSSYWPDIRWILAADFENIENEKMPLLYRLRSRLANFRFYQALHRLKERLK